jgi:hypothetical protein
MRGEVKMNRIRLLQLKKPSFVMTLVLLTGVILLITGAGLLSLGLNSRTLAIRNATRIAARCAADAGLTKAICEMNERLENPLCGSYLVLAINEALPNCDATFSYSTVAKKDGEYIVRSVGKCGASQSTVYGRVRLQGRSEHGILVQDTISLKAGTLVDGFNSSDPTNTNVELQMGTTSILPDSIILNNGVVVDGDVLVGVGGDVNTVIKDLGAKTRYRYCMLEEMDFPTVTLPALPNKGTINAHSKTIIIHPKDSGEYNSITLKRGNQPAKLEITGGEVVLHITGDIDLGQDCEIEVKKGASLSLYVDGDILAGEDSGFNNQNVPANLKLWGLNEGEQQFQLNAKSEYFGQLYAPCATVTVRAKGNLYGAFTAKSFDMKSGGNIFYDGALRNVDLNDEGVRFILTRWRQE